MTINTINNNYPSSKKESPTGTKQNTKPKQNNEAKGKGSVVHSVDFSQRRLGWCCTLWDERDGILFFSHRTTYALRESLRDITGKKRPKRTP